MKHTFNSEWGTFQLFSKPGIVTKDTFTFLVSYAERKNKEVKVIWLVDKDGNRANKNSNYISFDLTKPDILQRTTQSKTDTGYVTKIITEIVDEKRMYEFEDYLKLI
jgi:hypothetical protein